MARKQPSSASSLVNLPYGSRQYWEGQYDALVDCTRILRKLANQPQSTEQLNRLAAAIETKARLLAFNKLGERPNPTEPPEVKP